MITDLANLGPSPRGMADLGGAKGKSSLKPAQTQPETASSFGQILKARESGKEVRATASMKDPSPGRPGWEDAKPVKVKADDIEASSNKNEPRTARNNQDKSENWEDPGSVKAKEQSETSGKARSSSAREQVMLEFMDSMESEFGVLPQEMVEAMTQIPESDQLKSPEASASQVITELGLPKDQEEKAFALYVGMLGQLQQSQPQPQWKTPALSATAAVASAPVMLSSQQRRALLNESLDRMNQKFFMQGPEGRPETKAFFQPPADGAKASLGMDTPLNNELASLGRQEPLMNGYQKLPDSMGRQTFALPDGMEKVDVNSEEGQRLLKSLAALSATAAALDQGLKSDPQTAQALQMEQGLPAIGNSEESLQLAGGAPGEAGDEPSDGFSKDGGEQASVDSFFSGPSHHQEAHRAAPNFRESLAGVGGAHAANGMMGSDDSAQQANVQQLMKQAQYMIKKGGGEAKIQMAPEGVGQIHMKVVVNEGKVNLEMSAETKEAKKLIENSLHDLKASLSQHRLAMDSVKVDVGSQASNDNRNPDFQNQRQMDMRQDQGKDQTRQFWGEFHQNGGFDRRGTFHDGPGIRAYGGQSRQPQPLTPSTSGAVGERRYTGSGKGRGLNLVA